MTHLKIELNNGIIEEVSSAVIDKLYDIVHSGTLDNTSNLIGRLHTSATYQDYIDYLEDTFKVNNVKLLIIDATKKYLKFEDPAVLSVLASTYGDGVGVVLLDMSAITELRLDLFRDNTIVTHFNELGLFQSIKKIGSGCFREASNLLSIDLSNITQIGGSAFQSCSNLENVLFEDSVYSYNANTGYIEVCPPLVSIGGSAFLNCSKAFKMATLGQTTAKMHLILNDCTDIGYSAFNGAGISAVSISNSPSFGGLDIFKSCSNLEYVSIPNIKSIPDGMFRECSNLSTVVLSNLITEIGGGAFFRTNLSGPFTIPATVTSIGAAAFADNHITCLIFEGSTPPSTLGGWGWPNIPVYVPDAAVSDYLTAFAAATNNAIKNNILPISNYNPT